MNKVCRIGTHLFHFAEYVNALRGWGRGLRNAVGHWYVDRGAEDLAHQAVKYQQRDGWSHADLLRLAQLFSRLRERAPRRLRGTIAAWEAVFAESDRIPAKSSRRYVSEVKVLAQEIIAELGGIR